MSEQLLVDKDDLDIQLGVIAEAIDRIADPDFSDWMEARNEVHWRAHVLYALGLISAEDRCHITEKTMGGG